ncbi:response regulator transcription factor [Bizionia argentinensis JUB59]|uniref:Response regulator transcription factor n=1 Tax=Bizionia argentinensis JUB59 TaxID=1046627 RepID=G2EFH1_9FLAO|nr:response regulator transcription factor [Bizionia argentinensis]EGV42816.1 response regulator transcription factor [Bizionia argentinensis JUB59]
MAKTNITIVIAEDHPIMLKGLKQELEQAGYSIIGTAVNGKEAVETIKNLKPQIALLDIEMPFLTGFEVMTACKENKDLQTRFVVMTYHKQKNFVAQAKKLGVHGYLLKEDSMEEIKKCIATVMANGIHFSRSFSDNFETNVENELKKFALLTPSERKIVELIATGKTSNEISDMLCVSPRTIQKHRTNIIEKLRLDPTPDSLILWAKEYKE